jgi:PAS domain S-box-containing protein
VHAALAGIFFAAPDGILTVDEQGCVTHANPACETMFGAERGKLAGDPVEKWIPGAWRSRFTASDWSAQVVEVACLRADGSTFPAELTASRAASGTSLVVIIRDCSVLRGLEREVLESSEAVRRNFGRDLHDGLGQLLTGIAFLAYGLARDVPEEQRARAERLMTLVNSAIARTHQIAEGLAPALPQGSSVGEQLAEFAQMVTETYGLDCPFETRGDLSQLDPEAGIQVFMIAQEAIMNAVRHAKCRHIAVELTREGPLYSLKVSDDGSGLLSAPRPNGLGIRSMGYRARVLGGHLELLTDRQRGGLEVRCRFHRAG